MWWLLDENPFNLQPILLFNNFIKNKTELNSSYLHIATLIDTKQLNCTFYDHYP